MAIIMDGNGRWAKKRKWSRILGHQKGVEAVRRVVRTSREIGIPWLTLYSFSEENWKRPAREINALMDLLKKFLIEELTEMMENGISLRAIGRLSKLPQDVRDILFDTIEKTSGNRGMVLTLALSYGGRQEIMDAVAHVAGKVEREEIRSDQITEEMFSNFLYTKGVPDPDLMIRTSGEYRISNFMLWQMAYTEIFISPTLWPDFTREEFLSAIDAFQKRERRFGGT